MLLKNIKLGQSHQDNFSLWYDIYYYISVVRKPYSWRIKWINKTLKNTDYTNNNVFKVLMWKVKIITSNKEKIKAYQSAFDTVDAPEIAADLNVTFLGIKLNPY